MATPLKTALDGLRRRTTLEAADLLKVPYYKLDYLIKTRRVFPERDLKNGYAWSDADIEKARTVLNSRRPRGRRREAVHAH